MYCPICGAELLSGKTTRVWCPNILCPFKDRRMGNTSVDPQMERRRGPGCALPDTGYNERVWVKKGVENLIYNV